LPSSIQQFSTFEAHCLEAFPVLRIGELAVSARMRRGCFPLAPKHQARSKTLNPTRVEIEPKIAAEPRTDVSPRTQQPIPVPPLNRSRNIKTRHWSR